MVLQVFRNNGKLAERQGRKATGLRLLFRSYDSWVAVKNRSFVFIAIRLFRFIRDGLFCSSGAIVSTSTKKGEIYNEADFELEMAGRYSV